MRFMSNTHIKIRKLSNADYQSWSFLWRAYLDFYDTQREEEIYKFTFSRLIDRNEESCGAYIAFIDNTAVGIVHFIYHLHLWQKRTYLLPTRLICRWKISKKRHSGKFDQWGLHRGWSAQGKRCLLAYARFQRQSQRIIWQDRHADFLHKVYAIIKFKLIICKTDEHR